MGLMEHIAQEELPLRLWVYWLILINTASILFVIWHNEARWVLAAWLVNALIIMPALYEQFGYVRLLGLAHILVWTPLLVYLAPRIRRLPPRSLFGAYIWVLFLSNFVSLIFDYVDIVRYMAGDATLG